MIDRIIKSKFWNVMLIIVSLVLLAASGVFIEYAWGNIWQQWIYKDMPIFLGVIGVIILISYGSRFVQKNIPVWGYVYSMVVSVYLAYCAVSELYLNKVMSSLYVMISFAAVIIIFFYFGNLLWAVAFKLLLNRDTLTRSFNKKQYKRALILIATIYFIVYYYIPAEIFFHNFMDFGFPYYILAIAFLIIFLFGVIVLPAIFAIMREKIFNVLYSMLVGVMLGIYIQYMFMNKNVGIVDGSSFDFKKYLGTTIIDMVIWLVLIIGSLLFGLKKDKLFKSITGYLVPCAGLLHIVSFVMLLITAKPECFDYQAVYYSFEEQYQFGEDGNIIIFIVDAADNKFISEMIDNDMPELSMLKDYTIYTNTCSVYDKTDMSLLQMVTNEPVNPSLNGNDRRRVAWELESTGEFFDRLHSADYKVNFFNFDYEKTEGVIGNIDNAIKYDKNKTNIQYTNYKGVKRSTKELIKYSVYPTLIKSRARLNMVSYTNVVVYNVATGYYENADFAGHMNPEPGSNGRYVIYQHIDGCHVPNDNVTTLIDCLEMIDEYCSKMKECGAYDKSTIIITADHGCMDSLDVDSGEIYASTPMFAIKRPGEVRDSYVTNSAPISFTDLQATILDCAGLYDAAADEEMFGTTIFMHEEGELRERTWYNGCYDKRYANVGRFNTLYSYTFTGDTKEFERVVRENENLTIYPIPMQYE